MARAWEFFDDPAAFLAVAGGHLALDPVLNTVVAGIAERSVREGVPADGTPHWYAVTRAVDGRVDGVAMRTAPFAPHPPYVLPMPEDAAVGLARLMHARGKHFAGVNGALPATQWFADEGATLTGRTASVCIHTRLFELREVIAPSVPPGDLRPAAPGDADLALEWFRAFHREADEQAGWESGHDDGSAATRDDVVARIETGRLFFWEVDGERVHLTGASPPTYGVSRIGPVFTPREHRGRGYASAAVARVSQQILDIGARPCLFTDRANPVSNAIYRAIGYEPVADMANFVVE